VEAKRAGIAYGWMWFKQGIWLFKRNPFLWMFLTSLLVVGMFALMLFPFIGPFLPGVLFPAFFAGLMLGCHALAEEKPLQPQHLLAGFQSHGARLLSLGALNAVVNVLVGKLLVEAAGGASFENDLKTVLQAQDPDAMMQALQQTGIMLPMYAMVLMSVLLQFLVQLAAMLVVFRGAAPLPALLAALRATLLNALPLLVYALMVLPLALLASLPAMLGWLVLLPILLTTQYAIYRDLFPMAGDIKPPPATEAPPQG
jgi:hypothetical protein